LLKHSNKPNNKKINIELEVEKKLPELLKGKNSITILKNKAL
jgi:hypothetical protein